MYTWGTRLYNLTKLVQQKIYPAILYKLAGSNSCLNPLVQHFWPGKLVQACRANNYLNQLGSLFFTQQPCKFAGSNMVWTNLVQTTFDPASLYKLAGSKICWTKWVQVGSTNPWPGKLVQAFPSLPGQRFVARVSDTCTCRGYVYIYMCQAPLGSILTFLFVSSVSLAWSGLVWSLLVLRGKGVWPWPSSSLP